MIHKSHANADAQRRRAEAAEAKCERLRDLIARAVEQEEQDTVSPQARHSMWREMRRALAADQDEGGYKTAGPSAPYDPDNVAADQQGEREDEDRPRVSRINPSDM